MTEVVEAGICTSCGACIALAKNPLSTMKGTPSGPVPHFAADEDLPDLAWEACPGKGIDYPALYRAHYRAIPDNWLLGMHLRVRTGHAADPAVRLAGASGGVTTAVLIHLLQSGRIDAALVVRQGVPVPEEASVVVANTAEKIAAAAQSVYIPVSTLDILRRLEPGKRYAMTCVPEQAAALRQLQAGGYEPARQIAYVLGPYTGTALEPAAIRAILRTHRVRDDDAITSLQWRAGEWPGYLEIKTASGAVVRSKKVYYNYLIPFFVTKTSLQSMDFGNEFCDLSVGDAWSPRFEALGAGHSVFTTRSAAMEEVIAEMERAGLLLTEPEDAMKASEMHGHMLDFKKRGGYLRNQWRRKTGRKAPDYGLRPAAVPFSRIVIEAVISTIFCVARSPLARWLLQSVPENWIGPVFNFTRLRWKQLSKPTKRKGLLGLQMQAATPVWKTHV